MKDKELIKNYIFNITIFLNGIIIFFPTEFKFIPIAILSIVAVIFSRFQRSNLKLFLISIIPFALLVVGLMHTENMSYGMRKIEIGLSLLIFPTCFFLLSDQRTFFERSKVNIFFTSLSLSIILFASSVFLYYWYSYNLIWIFNHFITVVNKLPYGFGVHPIYLSLFFGASFLFSYDIIIKKPSIKTLWLHIVLIVLILFFLALINKRAAILGVVLIVVIRNFQLNTRFFAVMIGMILMFILVFTIPRYKGINGFKEFYNLKESVNNKTSIGKRYKIYKTSWEVFKENPLTGEGVGDVNPTLTTIANFDDNEGTYINSHNQMLSYFLSVGIVGGLVFMVYLIYIGRISLRSKDDLFQNYFLFFLFFMMIENILEREAGVILYSFIIYFFLFKYKSHFLLNTKIVD